MAQTHVVAAPPASWSLRPFSFVTQRPFFDLSPPSNVTPLHAYEPYLVSERMIHEGVHRLGPLMTMPKGYRRLLVEESRLQAFAVAAPEELPPGLRSARWQTLCDRWIARRELDRSALLALAQTLASLTLHDAALSVLSSIAVGGRLDETDAVLLALRGKLTFLSGTSPAVPDDLLVVIDDAPHDSLGRVQALLMAAEIEALYQHDVGAVEALLDAAGTAAAQARNQLSHADAVRLTAGLQAVRGRHMLGLGAERLELIGDALLQLDDIALSNGEDAVLAREARRRIIDFRTMVARELLEWDLAAVSAAEAVALDPFDAKARFIFGDILYRLGRDDEALAAYRQGSRLGPVATAESRYMAGVCSMRLGNREAAIDFFLSALDADPTSRSAHAALERCARDLELVELLAMLEQADAATGELS